MSLNHNNHWVAWIDYHGVEALLGWINIWPPLSREFELWIVLFLDIDTCQSLEVSPSSFCQAESSSLVFKGLKVKKELLGMAGAGLTNY
jgi:hypothetical protein